jgi:hypothetical protein
MRTLAVSTATVGLLLAGSFFAFGQGKQKSFRATLNGYSEVPAVSSTGSGLFRATADQSDTSLSYELSYANLEGTVTVAHVHLGQTGVNGGVLFFLCGGGGKPACPASGTVIGTVIAADVIGPVGQGIAAGEFAEILQAMRSGVTYANVHTTEFPGGEIRGQVSDSASEK